LKRGRLSRRKAAAQRSVGISPVINWVRRFRESGSVLRGKIGRHRPKAIVDEHRAWLLLRIKQKDFTPRGLVAELASRGLKVDYKTMWNLVHAEKLSFKKTVLASEQDRPDVARRREQWKKYQTRIAPERLVFIHRERLRGGSQSRPRRNDQGSFRDPKSAPFRIGR
jgi:transposase